MTPHLIVSAASVKELSDDLHNRIKQLCEEGDALAEAQPFEEATSSYDRALLLLPEPFYDWKAATWILTAIADAHFLAGEFEPARVALTRVMLCPTALDNPFIWLRRGEVYFELGDLQQAQDSLASAFMLGGREVFESEDPKYAAAFIFPKLKGN